MSKYLIFKLFEQKEKTQHWLVQSKLHGSLLGEIKWWGPWRQYVFFPQPETLFNPECMKDICQFIEELMARRKAG